MVTLEIAGTHPKQPAPRSRWGVAAKLAGLSLVAACGLTACGGGGTGPDSASAEQADSRKTAQAVDPVVGAIFTTDSTCTQVNGNIYDAKVDVYLDGGPAKTGAAGLTPGSYYVKVTAPDGTLLGTSVGAPNETPATVGANGEIDQCLQLWTILVRPGGGTGYDNTPNPGGEYKAWLCNSAAFTESGCKTDNFKVRQREVASENPSLTVIKWYDANANGILDLGEALIEGWQITITYPDASVVVGLTSWGPFESPVGTYSVVESLSGANAGFTWIHTTPSSATTTLAPNSDSTVTFGNVCVGSGGGLTLGFWSNKNGQALVGADDLSMLSALNLRTATGADFNPATYSDLRTWLLNGTAVNMAYMLSVQLAAMELNVYNGKVNGGALVYAPGASSANSLGFTSVNALMTEANISLGLHADTTAAGPDRTYQEALKNALDNANNNKTFVQPSADRCGPLSFAS